MQRCRSQEALLTPLLEKLWNIYHAADAPEFIERLRHLQSWAIAQPLSEPMVEVEVNSKNTQLIRIRNSERVEAADLG
jgi:hypothetical protein